MKEVKKSPVKKVASKAAAPKKVSPKAAPKKAPAKKAVAASKPDLSPEERYRIIQDEAYFVAERHGFNGDSAYFWSLAEAEINRRYS